MTERKILVFTGSRGEWGYLRPVLFELRQRNIHFDIVVSNMHLEEVHGMTKNDIIQDGFEISKEIYMNISGNNSGNWSRSLGLLLFQVPDILNSFAPDIVLIAGDRAETFIFSIACFYMNIPTAHIQAGELSGHKDGMARHAIGKLANIHFASNEDAYSRLIKFGEAEFRTFLTGAPQLDDILSAAYSEEKRDLILSKLRLKNTEYVICIFHPSSDDPDVLETAKSVYNELETSELHQIWVLPNSDSGGSEIIQFIVNMNRRNVTIVNNLIRSEFLQLLYFAKVLIGNSSAGILEAPAIGTPSINLGLRQKGRIAAQSVFSLPRFQLNEFRRLLKKSMVFKRGNYSLYGDGKSSERIVDVLTGIQLNDKLLNKYVE
jgi:GDP/UDP-N,N'-diacetylbacillosamine 2-epimerase (hydrolysing)